MGRIWIFCRILRQINCRIRISGRISSGGRISVFSQDIENNSIFWVSILQQYWHFFIQVPFLSIKIWNDETKVDGNVKSLIFVLNNQISGQIIRLNDRIPNIQFSKNRISGHPAKVNIWPDNIRPPPLVYTIFINYIKIIYPPNRAHNIFYPIFLCATGWREWSLGARPPLPFFSRSGNSFENTTFLYPFWVRKLKNLY